MRTVSFQSVLFGVATLMGMDPTRNLQPNQAAAWGSYIKNRVAEAWEGFPWPELCPTERRTYAPVFSLAGSYTLGAVVFDPWSNAFYRCVADQATGRAVADGAYWQPVPFVRRMIPYTQPGENPIGEMLEAYGWCEEPGLALQEPGNNGQIWPAWQGCEDDREWRRRRQLSFRLGMEGVEFAPGAPNVVVVTYKIRTSEFAGVAWSAAQPYSNGTVIQWTDGECYAAIGAVAAGTAPAAGGNASWAWQPLPYVLRDFVRLASYADALREDGQQDKAHVEETRAMNRLEDEMEKIVVQQQQSATFVIRR